MGRPRQQFGKRLSSISKVCAQTIFRFLRHPVGSTTSKSLHNSVKRQLSGTKLSSIAKLLLAVEVVFCFGPLIFLWALGVTLLPAHFNLLFTNTNLGSFLFVAWIAAASIGFISLLGVLRALFTNKSRNLNPTFAKSGIVLGFLAILPLIHPAFPNPWNLLAVIPLIATAHIAYLARSYLFDPDMRS